MALKKTAGSIDGFRLVSIRDNAIDRENSDVDAYVENMEYDLAHLSFLPGETPTFFVCRSLTAGEMRRIQDAPIQRGDGTAIGFGSMVWLAFRHGVESMENFEGWSEKFRIKGHPPLVSERWIDENLYFETVQEIGLAILNRSKLGEDDLKNC